MSAIPDRPWPVSIVMPAHNAAATIAESIESVTRQTSPHWELIVVDDGSTDETAAIVDRFAAKDTRIRCVRAPSQGGVSHARNQGTLSARFEWILYLDADDWLVSTYLEKMTAVLAQNPQIDAVYCGWVRVTPDGRLVNEQYHSHSEDLFEPLTWYCAFSVHACVVRKSLVETVGGWDPSLRTCEDWDLWLRIARTGARFAALHEFLAVYRMRPGSASLKGLQYLKDGLRVIHRAHAPDPRVPNPDPKHAAGAETSGLASAVFRFLSWPAGLVLGSGGDARPLLDAVTVDRDPSLDPGTVAKSILEAALLPTAKHPDAWPEFWPTVEFQLDQFLFALEQRSGVPALARRARILMERGAVKDSALPSPVQIGRLHAFRFEVTEPLHDVRLPLGTERLMCALELEGQRLGSLDLPVADALVPSSLLADAGSNFWWAILGRFFARTVYAELQLTPNETGLAVSRGDLRLVERLVGSDVMEQIHARVGWTVFLQELWGRPRAPASWFYSETAPDDDAPVRHVRAGERVVIEISDDLPTLEAEADISVDVRLGGMSLGWLGWPVRSLSAQQLRVGITRAIGKELGRMATREALFGRPLVGGGTLRERLAAASGVRASGLASDNQTSADDSSAQAAANRALRSAPGIVLARRAVGATGTSASRPAMFPVAVAADLVETAERRGDPVVRITSGATPAERILYAPHVICSRSAALTIAPPPRTAARNGAPSTHKFSILMYHRVGDPPSGAAARYCVSPAAFETQLSLLRDSGFYSLTLEEWRVAWESRTPLRARPLLMTFDDGYEDFKIHAWPLLKRYGFGALVFLVTGEVGGSNRWDAGHDAEPISLLGWGDVRQLRDEGVEFGSHSVTHPYLTGLSHEDVIREAARSQMALEHELGRSVLTFAYPYGDMDEIVQHWIGACGYTFGLTCRPGPATHKDSMLALPRIEITGTDTIDDVARKIAV